MLEIEIDVIKGFESFVLKKIDEFKKQGFIFKSYGTWEKEKNKRDADFHKKSNEEKDTLYKRDLIYEYSNLRQRLIPAKPRKIIYSNNFKRIPEYEIGLKSLEEKVKNGESLTPHLSRKIFDADFQDGLLFDFGVFITCISAKKKTQGIQDLLKGEKKFCIRYLQKILLFLFA